MVKALFDTCILIDFLNGEKKAESELDLYDDKGISIITWMEVMIGTDSETELPTRRWLDRVFTVEGLDPAISELAVRIRKAHKIKLPDAIIYGTAECSNRLLVTRNTKDFSKNDPKVRIPYKP